MQSHMTCFAIGLWFSLVASLAPARAADSAPPLAVKVVHPQRGEITRFITLPGNVRAYQQATLYAKVAGYLKSISVDKGDAVKEGALLAEIEVPELIADRAKYKAEVEVAKIDYDRVREAQSKAPDLVVPQTVDNAKGKFEIAKANLERIETLLGFAKLTAPFAGVVTTRNVDAGAFIPAATSGSAANTAAVLTLMDFSKVRVQVAVPEPEVPLVAKGEPVKVSIEELPGRSFDGTITRFAYALDDTTKTMLAEAELDNAKWELRPGMFATVKIGIERKIDALLVPAEAVVMEKNNAFVFTVVDGKAKKVAVKIGFSDAGKMEIVSGVAASDRVILVGKQTLTDGQPVNAVEAR